MASRFATPEALVEGLHQRDESARAQLKEWLGEAIRRLLQELQARYNLPHKLDRLTTHALHACETYLRTHPGDEYSGMSLPAFRATVLLHVARLIVQPFGSSTSFATDAPGPLPDTDDYSFQTVFLPSEKIGSFWFGGDWYGGHRAADGTFWLIIADITGHGYAAYLLANALPAVWKKCWEELRVSSRSRPGDVLGVLHELIRDSLPEDVYVECTLLRLDPDGTATLAPAGGSRLLLRQGRKGTVDLLKLRGLWLGLERALPDDQHSCVLEAGDELLLGSDGVFDQLLEYHGGEGGLTELIGQGLQRGDLLQAVQAELQRALQARPQKDDITAVLVRRRAESNGQTPRIKVPPSIPPS